MLKDSRAVYTPGLSEHAGSASKFYHADALGSTRGITDATQATTDAVLYDAFGMTVSRTGSTATPFGFVGAQQYQTDSDSGLMLLGHRYFDPSVGRFISADPAKAGTNWWAYCENGPLRATDPSGFDWHDGWFDDGNGYAVGPLPRTGHRDGGHLDIGTGISVIGSVSWLERSRRTVAFVKLSVDLATNGITGPPKGPTVPYTPPDSRIIRPVRPPKPTAPRPPIRGGGPGGPTPPEPEPPTGVGGGGHSLGPPEGGGGGGAYYHGSGSSCFPAGTLILLPNAKKKPIDQIQPGERIASREPLSSRNVMAVVIRRYVHWTTRRILLTFANGETIETTPEHRFYVYGFGFVTADKIKLGARCSTSHYGMVKLVGAAQSRTTPRLVYNLEVRTTHTYFVGQSELWVHNEKPHNE